MKEPGTYKSLADKWIAQDGGRFCTFYDKKTFKYGIWDKARNKFASGDRWVREKYAKEFLAISVALGRI